MVELNAALVREIDARYAVIVTERQYSTRQRYQTIVPVLDGAEYLPTANDVQVTQGAWLRAVGMTSAILTVPDVFSVWHRTLISRALPAVVDQAAMGAVDEALRVHFGL